MGYKVIITPPAQRRLDMYVGYTLNTLRSKQAARAILDDARRTKSILAFTAQSNRLCEHPVLNKYGYRKMYFQRHRFVMLYRIEGNVVIVDGMYHELQDYESVFVNDMQLT